MASVSLGPAGLLWPGGPSSGPAQSRCLRSTDTHLRSSAGVSSGAKRVLSNTEATVLGSPASQGPLFPNSLGQHCFISGDRQGLALCHHLLRRHVQKAPVSYLARGTRRPRVHLGSSSSGDLDVHPKLHDLRLVTSPLCGSAFLPAEWALPIATVQAEDASEGGTGQRLRHRLRKCR